MDGRPGRSPHRRWVRVVSKIVVAAGASLALTALALRSNPVDPDMSVLVYYASAVAAGLAGVAAYEFASRLVMLALSAVVGRAPAVATVQGRPSVLTVRGGMAVFAAYLGGMIVVTLLAGLTLAVIGAAQGVRVDRLDIRQLTWILPLSMAAGAGTVFAYLKRRATLRDWVVMRRWRAMPSRRTMLLTAAGGLVVGTIGGMLLPLAAPPPDGFEPGVLVRMSTTEGWPRVVVALIAILLAPPVEEFVFRGVLLEGLLGVSSRAVAVAATSLLFAAIHLPDLWGYWAGALWIYLGAVALAEVRIRTRSLLAPVLGHASYNAALVVMAFLAPG